MCGIAGHFDRDPAGVADRSRLERMCDAIAHRGPDDHGHFVRGPVGLGIRRLSIIDPVGGRQPISTPDGRFTIVFNGEIYNYRAVRAELEARGCRFTTASDTEVVLHAFAEYGPECLTFLNGMFAIAIWDAVSQELFLARDRIGIKPLFFCDDGRSILFASEMRALLADPAVPRALDPAGLDYFMRYGYVAAPATLVRAIRKVAPAHYMCIGRDCIRTHQYWKLDHEIDIRPEQEHAEHVYECLRRCVERQLVSDVPVGAFLSGGLDSSSIVRLMADLTGQPTNTFSIGFAGRDAFHNELPDASMIASTYNTAHHELLVDEGIVTRIPSIIARLDQPLADSSFIVTYLIAQLARQSVKTVMSGVGGDEIFGGYRRYLGPALGRYYGWIPHPAREFVRANMARVPVDRGSSLTNIARLARAFVAAHDLPAFEQYDRAVRLTSDSVLARLVTGSPQPSSALVAQRRAAFDEPLGRGPVARMMNLDLQTSLPESLLLLTDNMTMAASLEARVPFLDHELVQLAARVPSSMKIKGTRLRYLQKQSMRPYLPEEVFRKRKWGFGCPVGRWFRGELRELLQDQLSPSRVRRKGIFQPEVVQSLIAEHEQRREDHADVLLGLLTFDMWHSEWVER
jgi:asparagine synthase (glutamine-hydrolysing)